MTKQRKSMKKLSKKLKAKAKSKKSKTKPKRKKITQTPTETEVPAIAVEAVAPTYIMAMDPPPGVCPPAKA